MFDVNTYERVRNVAFDRLWLYLGTLLDCAKEDPEGTIEWAEGLRESGQQAADDMPEAAQELVAVGPALVNALADFLQAAARAALSDRESEERLVHSGD